MIETEVKIKMLENRIRVLEAQIKHKKIQIDGCKREILRIKEGIESYVKSR